MSSRRASAVLALALALPVTVAAQVLRIVKPSIPASGGEEPPPGGGTIIFVDTLQTSGSAPNYGFETVTTDQVNIRWTKTYRTGVGPGGQNALEFASIAPSGSVPGGTAQGQHGFFFTNGVETNFGYNQPSRFAAFSFYFPSDNTGLCDRDGSAAVELGRCSFKWLVNAEGCSTSPCRAILTVDIWDQGSGPRIRFGQAIDGGISQTETDWIYLTATWYHVVWEINGNSAAGVADGGYKLWVGAQGATKTYAAPDLDSGGIVLNIGSGQGGYWYTGYNNAEGLTSGNVVKLYLGRWRISTEFDTGWFTW